MANMSLQICYSFFAILIFRISCIEATNSLSNVWKTQEWGSLPQDASDLISIIFHRYAADQQGLTVDEFEQLNNCTLGLSQCIHTSVSNTALSYLTNCTINSAISNKQCDVLHKCIQARHLLSLLPSFNESTSRITEADLKLLLPSILYQAQSQICKEEENQVEISTRHKKPTSVEVWGYGILFVTLISACSLAGVSVLPLMGREFYQKLLTVLIGLAVGSLAASAVFHLIPQAYGLIETTPHHEYLNISLVILFGVWAFFMIEQILKIIFMRQKCCSHKLPNSTSSQAIVPRPSKEQGEVGPCATGYDNHLPSSDINCDNSNHVASPNHVNVECDDGKSAAQNLQLIYASQKQAAKASFGHQENPEVVHPGESHELVLEEEGSGVATVAWMIIFGDGFHNFIDGVSIGAAFQQSILTGISISLAVMCEELPHELGDFAVLLNSGMSMKQALGYNFLSATTCYLGMFLGILLGEFTQNSTFIFALAAGMFLYISLVDMIPEMNSTAARASDKGLGDVLYVLFLQNVGMFLGVFSLFLLAYYQDNITLD